MFDDNLPSEQRAEGNYIAQADRGGIATVNVTLSDSLTPAEKRNRNEMLRKIQERIEQKLKTSLYNNFMLDISLQYWSDVVIYAKEIEFTESTEDNILHCFDVNDGKLLILGEPGSGKTILLFSLASSLVNRAISDISSSIPVILNLSSWSNKLKSLDEWISEELYNKYDVSNNLSRKWLNDNTLILLLDGLDEVADKSRAECIENINEFRSRYHAQMVICTREQEYEALEEQLMLQGAVLVQPPSDEQINSYLSQPGLEGLQIVVGESEQLHELLKNILTLDIMSKTYRNMSPAIVSDFVKEAISKHPNNTLDFSFFRRKLFHDYIQRMFDHHLTKSFQTKRSVNSPNNLSKQEPIRQATLDWLGWLAHRMVNHNETILFFENIQPSWLERRGQRFIYHFLVFIILSLLGGLVVGGGRWLISDVKISFFESFVLGSGTILFFSFMASISSIEPVQKLRLSEASLVGGIRTFTNSGFIAGMITSTGGLGRNGMSITDNITVLVGVILGYLAVWFIASFVVFLLYLKSGRQREVLKTFFILTSRTKSTKRFLEGAEEIDISPIPRSPFRLILFVSSLALAPIVALIDYTTTILNGYLATTFGTILAFGLAAMIIGIVGPGIYFGLTGESIDQRDEVNQGIKRSIRTAVFGGLLSGIGATLLAGNLWARFFDTPGTLLNLPVGFFLIGFSATYLGFLRLGGSAFFQHYTLRFLLILFSYTPFNYRHFLDYASDLLFLRKLGGGYEYVHRDLMEYFAEVYSEVKYIE